jgi:hypothetical protein
MSSIGIFDRLARGDLANQMIGGVVAGLGVTVASGFVASKLSHRNAMWTVGSAAAGGGLVMLGGWAAMYAGPMLHGPFRGVAFSDRLENVRRAVADLNWGPKVTHMGMISAGYGMGTAAGLGIACAISGAFDSGSGTAAKAKS